MKLFNKACRGLLAACLIFTMLFSDMNTINATNGTKEVAVGEEFKIKGEYAWYNDHKWYIENDQGIIEIAKGKNKQEVTILAKKAGEATLVHCYGNKSEKYNIRVSEDLFYYTFSSKSSNVDLFYSVSGGDLTKLDNDQTLETNRNNKVVFFVKVKEGYASGTRFSHKNGENEKDKNNADWKQDGIYTKIDDFNVSDIGNEFKSAYQTALNMDCAYEFHYSDRSPEYRYREFKINGNPVTILVQYDLNGGTGDIFDNNKYAYPNVNEDNYLNTIALTDKIPQKNKTKFIGWQLDINGEIYHSSDIVEIKDVWQTPDTQQEIYKFTALYEDLYNVHYYKDLNNEFDNSLQDTNLYPYKEEIALLDATNKNGDYQFIGWTTDSHLVGNENNIISSKTLYDEILKSNQFYQTSTSFVMPNHDVNLYAVWVPKEINDTYKIIVINDEGIEATSSIDVSYGDSQSIHYQAKDGYLINSVLVDDTPIDDINGEYIFTNITGNHTIEITSKEDTGKVKTLSYTVEHYLEGNEQPNTAFEYKENVWIHSPQTTLKIQARSLNSQNYNGYMQDEINYKVGDEVSDGTVIKIYYSKIKKDLNYKIVYHLADIKDIREDKKVEIWSLEDTITLDETFLNSLINKFPNYVLDESKEIVKEVREGQTVDIYYLKDDTKTRDFKYSIYYYKDDVYVDKDEITTSVFAGLPSDIKIKADLSNVTQNRYAGYKLSNKQIEDEVTHNGIINVYYDKDSTDKRDFIYHIAYYKDNELFETVNITDIKIWAGEPDNIQIDADLSGVTNDRYSGYSLSNKEIVTKVANGETINVYYEKDEKKERTFSYTIEYYLNNELFDQEQINTMIWDGLSMDTELDIDSSSITNNRYVGYKLSDQIIQNKVKNGGVIKVYYIRDDNQVKNLSYQVRHIIDQNVIEVDSYTKTIWAGETTNRLEVTPIVYRDYEGYIVDYTDPISIPTSIENNGIINVSYTEDRVGTNPNNPNIGDGIADKYQVQVSFEAVNGSVSFATAYVTLLDENQQPSINGVGYLADNQIPLISANPGYDANSASWGTDGQPSIEKPITSDVVYRVSFVAVVPVIPTTPVTPVPPTVTPPIAPIVITPNPTLPVVTIAPIAIPTATAPTIDEQEVVPVVEEINENEVPLANGLQEYSTQTVGYWALINLICVLATIILSGLLWLSKRKIENDKESKKRNKRRKFVTLGIALVSFVLFIFTEDILLPVRLFDKWSIWMALILLLQFIVFTRCKNNEHEHIS